MPLPKVAIVGRPNVGKSSLFNWIAGRKIAIVDDVAGVTRDRVGALVQLGEEENSRFIELIDTGGIGIVDPLQYLPLGRTAGAHLQPRRVNLVVDARRLARRGCKTFEPAFPLHRPERSGADTCCFHCHPSFGRMQAARRRT